MQIKADTPEQYIGQLPEERKPVIEELRKVVLANLPEGFEVKQSIGHIMLILKMPKSMSWYC